MTKLPAILALSFSLHHGFITSYEPTHRYDFELRCPQFEVNSSMIRSAIINIQPDRLDSYKVQLLTRNATDKRVILADIEFTQLKSNLLPAYNRIHNYYARHPITFLINIFGLVAIVDAYSRVIERITKPHFSSSDRRTNGLTILDAPLCFALMGWLYINYSYNQIPVIKTVHHLNDLEKIYQACL